MTVWELIGQLSEAYPNAEIHFRVTMNEDLIAELAENKEKFTGEYFSVSDIYIDGTDVDINLEY